jgi:pimeloyl-ACP methyl ester carboxylesterase
MIKIRGISHFKSPENAAAFLQHWSEKVQRLNNCFYERIIVPTSLGNTNIWAYNRKDTEKETLVFFPGARTCGLFWDMDNALLPFKKSHRIFIVDVNGQPNLSDQSNPFIKDDGYGVWAKEVLEALDVNRVIAVGASLGGLICMKLSLAAPHLVHKIILMNPAGIGSFSASFENLYYNFLPIVFPSRRNVSAFFNKVAFHKPGHILPYNYVELMTEYMCYVLSNHRFKGDYPAPLRVNELEELVSPVYLILGDKDILFPCKNTMHIAKRHISSLKKIIVIPNIAHGIETSKQAISILFDLISNKKTELSHR